jgi:hypothetical protein
MRQWRNTRTPTSSDAGVVRKIVDRSGLQYSAAACVIAGGLLVAGPGVVVALADPGGIGQQDSEGSRHTTDSGGAARDRDGAAPSSTTSKLDGNPLKRRPGMRGGQRPTTGEQSGEGQQPGKGTGEGDGTGEGTQPPPCEDGGDRSCGGGRGSPSPSGGPGSPPPSGGPGSPPPSGGPGSPLPSGGLGSPPPGSGGSGAPSGHGGQRPPPVIVPSPPLQPQPGTAEPDIVGATAGPPAAPAPDAEPPVLTLPLVVLPPAPVVGAGGGPRLELSRGAPEAPPAGPPQLKNEPLNSPRQPIPVEVGRDVTPPPSFRAGYSEYLRTAGVTKMAAFALPGISGLLLLTAGGGFIGYRQAKTGYAVRTEGIARFLH